jgi:hypothetical protein
MVALASTFVCRAPVVTMATPHDPTAITALTRQSEEQDSRLAR